MINCAKIKCANCKTPIQTKEAEDEIHCVEIVRGFFKLGNDEPADSAIIECVRKKASLFLCVKCYLENPDLCSFFNKIGRQVR